MELHGIECSDSTPIIAQLQTTNIGTHPVVVRPYQRLMSFWRNCMAQNISQSLRVPSYQNVPYRHGEHNIPHQNFYCLVHHLFTKFKHQETKTFIKIH